jgi:cytochrome oxidase Cu insertion factor (SCO1/SenC/PrrC family)
MKSVILLLLTLTAALSQPTLAEKAIDFQFTDVSGKSLHLSDYRGKWVLVNFSAPWCLLSRAEVTTLNRLDSRNDVVVIGISLDYGPEASVVKVSAKSHDLNVTAIIAGGSRRDPHSAFRQVGPVDFYPTSYLYDPNGEIAMFIPGSLKQDKLLAYMQKWKQMRAHSGKKTSLQASAK